MAMFESNYPLVATPQVVCRYITGFRITLIRREGRDVDERGHFGIITRLGDHHSAIGMPNENNRSLCASMINLVAATSPSSETVGFWTILTLWPSFVRWL